MMHSLQTTLIRISIRQNLDESKRKSTPVLVSMDDVSVLNNEGEIIYPSRLSAKTTRKLHVPVPVSHDHHVQRVLLRIGVVVAHRRPADLGSMRLDLLVIGGNHDVALQNHHVVNQRVIVGIAQLARQWLPVTPFRAVLPPKQAASRRPSCL